MNNRRKTDYETYKTVDPETMSMLTKVILSAVTSILTWYASKWTVQKLQERPLKARLQDGKEAIAGLRESAKTKVSAAAAKAKVLIDDSADKTVEKLDDAQEQVDISKAEAKDKLNGV